MKSNHRGPFLARTTCRMTGAVAAPAQVMGDKSKRALYDERMGDDPVFRRMTEHRRNAPGAQSRGQRWSGSSGNSTVVQQLDTLVLATPIISIMLHSHSVDKTRTDISISNIINSTLVGVSCQDSMGMIPTAGRFAGVTNNYNIVMSRGALYGAKFSVLKVFVPR